MKLSQKIALNSSAQAGKQLFVAAAGIVSVGLVTRYLPIAQYGAILAAQVLVSLLSFATDFGISSMTVRAMARDPENEVAISSSAFWVWGAFNLPAAILILVAAQVFYPGAENSVTRESVLVMLGAFPLTPLAGVAGVRAVADQKVWATSLTSILGRALSLVTVVAVVVLDLGPLGVAAAFTSGYIFEQIFAILVIRPKVELRVGLHRARIWSLVAAAIPLGLVMMINGLYFRLDGFLLSVLGSNSDLAVYGVAYKGFESLLVLPEFVMITLLPVLARLDFKDSRFQDLVQKAFTSMTILVLPIFGFALLGREAMVALAGPKYAGGGLVLALIMCSVGFACIQGVFGNALVTQGRQSRLLWVSGSVLVVNGLINLAAIPLFGDRGAAATLLITEALSLTLTLRIYGQLAPIPRLYAVPRLLLALAALVVVVAACLLIPTTSAAIVVGVVLGLAAYAGVLISLRVLPPYMRDPFDAMLRSLLRRKPA